MTHFVVVVAGLDVEGLLAPYDEDGQWFRETDADPYALLSVPRDASDQQIKEGYERAARALTDVQEDELYHLDRARDLLLDPETRTEFDQNGPRPPSRWDWWEIGGRWSPYFKIKGGGQGDQALKHQIDVEAMREEVVDFSTEWWHRYQAVIKDSERPNPWTWYIKRVDDPDDEYTIEQAREDYGKQERVRRVSEHDAGAKPEETVGGFMFTPDRIPETFEDYLEFMRLGALSAAAYLDSDGWHENGKTGWWGVKLDQEESEAQWRRRFNDWFDGLADDVQVTAVDCHV